MALKDLFYEMAEEEGISVYVMEMMEGLPDHHCIRLQGEHAIYEGHALFLEEEKLFVFYVIWGVIVPEEKCEEMAWELMKKNYELKMGQWFIDPDSRVLTIRSTQYLNGEDEEEKMQRMYEIVSNCGRLADESFLELSAMLN